MISGEKQTQSFTIKYDGDENSLHSFAKKAIGAKFNIVAMTKQNKAPFYHYLADDHLTNFYALKDYRGGSHEDIWKITVRMFLLFKIGYLLYTFPCL